MQFHVNTKFFFSADKNDNEIICLKQNISVCVWLKWMVLNLTELCVL
jgi:hypothetical protein